MPASAKKDSAHVAYSETNSGAVQYPTLPQQYNQTIKEKNLKNYQLVAQEKPYCILRSEHLLLLWDKVGQSYTHRTQAGSAYLQNSKFQDKNQNFRE